MAFKRLRQWLECEFAQEQQDLSRLRRFLVSQVRLYRHVARETYRTLGEYVVTEADFLQATDFPDKVCNAFNYIDMHSSQIGCIETFLNDAELLPKIPLRSLIPKGSSRITVAGRIVSADRIAFAGIRAQCTCMAMGQAMGAAAALAVQKGVASREISSQDIVAVTVEHGAVPV